jgi:hypothetical protein
MERLVDPTVVVVAVVVPALLFQGLEEAGHDPSLCIVRRRAFKTSRTMLYAMSVASACAVRGGSAKF